MSKRANQDQASTDMEERKYDTPLQRPPRPNERRDHAPLRDPDIEKEKMEKRDDLGGTSVYQKKTKPGKKGEVQEPAISSGRSLADFEPKKDNLIALMKIEEKLNICLKFLSGAMSEFYALKSIDISPDGKLGGRGYVMEMSEIRAKLYQSVENVSAIIDTVYDEVSGEHWLELFGEHLPEVDEQLQKMEKDPDDLDVNFEKVSNILDCVRKVASTKSNWMAAFQAEVLKLDKKHSGKIDWDTATYLFNQHMSPVDAAKKYVE